MAMDTSKNNPRPNGEGTTTTNPTTKTKPKNEDTASTTSTSSTATPRVASPVNASTFSSSMDSSSSTANSTPKPATPPPITRPASTSPKKTGGGKKKNSSSSERSGESSATLRKRLKPRGGARSKSTKLTASIKDVKKEEEKEKGGGNTGNGSSRRLVEYFVVISSVPRKQPPPPPNGNSTAPPPPSPAPSTKTAATPPPTPPRPPHQSNSTPPTTPPPPKMNPRVAQRMNRLSVHLDPPTHTIESSSTGTTALETADDAIAAAAHAKHTMRKSLAGSLLRTVSKKTDLMKKSLELEEIPEKKEMELPFQPSELASTSADMNLMENTTSADTLDSSVDSSTIQDLSELSFEIDESLVHSTSPPKSDNLNHSLRLKSVDRDGKLHNDLKKRTILDMSSHSSDDTSGDDDARSTTSSVSNSSSLYSSPYSRSGNKAKEKMRLMKNKLKTSIVKKIKGKKEEEMVGEEIEVGMEEENPLLKLPPPSEESVRAHQKIERILDELEQIDNIPILEGSLHQEEEEEEEEKEVEYETAAEEEEEDQKTRSAPPPSLEDIQNDFEHHDEQPNESPPSTPPPPPPKDPPKERGASQNIHMPSKTPHNPQSPTPPPLYFQPVITAQYPPKDHPDSPLNPMLPHFCFPYSDVISLSLDYRMPRIHHFVLTNDMGKKIYGTCLTVYEEYVPPTPKNSPKTGPKMERTHSNQSLSSTTPPNGGGEGNYYGAVQDSETKDKAHEESIEVLISNSYPHTLYVPRVLCLLSMWPYLTAFREHLTQLYRLATSTNMMKAPLERYILNLCAEIPAPPPGAFEIRMKILNSTIRFWAPPANQPIPYVALPFGLLFECLDIGNILFVWYALALERKVLLVSSQYSILTVCAEILCSLLFPMQWSHLYIPILPRFLSPMLDAPMPYLCGVSRDNLPYAVGDINEETIVVDLDQNVITMGPLTQDLPPIPHKRRMKLELALEANVGDVFWNARGLTKKRVAKIQKLGDERFMDKVLEEGNALWAEKLKGFDEAFNLAYTPDSPNLLINDGTLLGAKKGKAEQSQWDAVQEAFLRFYVSILKDYRKFVSEEDKEDNSGGPKSKRWGPRRDFRTEEFIKAQRLDFQPFLEELCITQQFDDFVTKRMYNPGEPDVIFFDQSIDAKMNRSRLKLKKVDTPFLHSSKAHKELNTIDAVEPNTDDLPETEEENKYMYKSWPETFDPKLYGEPRPIPTIITAEFDRRSQLLMDLREKYAGSDDDDELMDLYGEECDPNPQVATFTVFFMTYTAVIGEELQLFEQKKKDLDRCLQEDEDLLGLHEVNAAESSSKAKENGNPPNFHGSIQSQDATSSGYTPYMNGVPLQAPFYECIDDGEIPGSGSFCCGEDMCDPNAIVKSLYESDNSDHAGVKTLHDGDNSNPSHVIDEKSSYFDVFFGKVDHSQTLNDATPTENGGNVARGTQGARPVSLSAFSELEEARAVAKAQMDLAFDALVMLRMRDMMPDPDVYRYMMDICSRSGDIERVRLLLAMIREDGLVVDSELYWRFMGAYSTANSAMGGVGGDGLGISDSPSASPSRKSWRKSFAASQKHTKKQIGFDRLASKLSTLSDTDSSGSDDSESEGTSMAESSGTKSSVGVKSSLSNSTATTERKTDDVSNNFASSIKSSIKSSNGIKKGKKKKATYSTSPKKKSSKKKLLLTTDGVKHQVELGENLLEMLYPDLHIDTSSNTCPKCFKKLKQDSIIFGWTPCDFQDYNTMCPQCHHSFMPRFSVKCSSPTFVGSQGKSTPLYCEFLSPWVMRKELLSVMKSDDGVSSLLDPEWRSDADINATLWWNLVVSFRRYKLPLTYLLQGSFSQRLIMPIPDAH